MKNPPPGGFFIAAKYSNREVESGLAYKEAKIK
jgi:hypothetical protein